MQIETKFNAGDLVYVGYLDEQGGEVFARILGPLHICKVDVTVQQLATKGKIDKTTTTIKYHANSVNVTYYDTKLREHAEQKELERQERITKEAMK